MPHVSEPRMPWGPRTHKVGRVTCSPLAVWKKREGKRVSERENVSLAEICMINGPLTGRQEFRVVAGLSVRFLGSRNGVDFSSSALGPWRRARNGVPISRQDLVASNGLVHTMNRALSSA